MVQANELRIGNWVEVFGVPAIVVEVNNKVANKSNPFSITSGILEKAGFSIDENGTYWLFLQTHYLELIETDCGWYPIYVQVPELSSEAEQRVSLNKIDSVHQLQNLIYILTGQELIIKL